MEQPSASDLSRKAGISPSYASMILTGSRRPPLSLAIHIFRQTGWRPPQIAELADAQIAALEAIESWTPRGSRAASENGSGDGSDHAVTDTAKAAEVLAGNINNLSGGTTNADSRPN